MNIFIFHLYQIKFFDFCVDITDYVSWLYIMFGYIYCCKHTLIKSLYVNSNQRYQDIDTTRLHDIVMGCVNAVTAHKQDDDNKSSICNKLDNIFSAITRSKQRAYSISRRNYYESVQNVKKSKVYINSDARIKRKN